MSIVLRMLVVLQDCLREFCEESLGFERRMISVLTRSFQNSNVLMTLMNEGTVDRSMSIFRAEDGSGLRAKIKINRSR